MFDYTRLVAELDRHLEEVFPRQVLDRQDPCCGGFVDGDRLVASNSISAVAPLGYAYLLAESRHFRSEEVLERILLAAAFARRHRRASGCFDLLHSGHVRANRGPFHRGGVAVIASVPDPCSVCPNASP